MRKDDLSQGWAAESGEKHPRFQLLWERFADKVYSGYKVLRLWPKASGWDDAGGLNRDCMKNTLGTG